jgi:hypothetical protein
VRGLDEGYEGKKGCGEAYLLMCRRLGVIFRDRGCGGMMELGVARLAIL